MSTLPADSALLVIDLQLDYAAGGRVPLPGIDIAMDRAATLIEAFRRARRPVIHVRHAERDPAVDFLREGSEGAEIDPRVAPLPGEPVVVKHWPNAFRHAWLHAVLSEAGIRQLVICGAMSNVCVDSSVRAAADFGYRCIVVEDACAACDLEFRGERIPARQVHGAFMAALASAYAEVATLQDLLEPDGRT